MCVEGGATLLIRFFGTETPIYSQFTKKKEDMARSREGKEERLKRKKVLRVAQNFSIGFIVKQLEKCAIKFYNEE